MATQSAFHDTENNNDVQAACLDLLCLQSCLEDIDEQLCPKAAGVSKQLESIDEGDAAVMKFVFWKTDLRVISRPWMQLRRNC